jgi:hypothetical protein
MARGKRATKSVERPECVTLGCHNEAVHGKSHCNVCLNKMALGQPLPKQKPKPIL